MKGRLLVIFGDEPHISAPMLSDCPTAEASGISGDDVVHTLRSNFQHGLTSLDVENLQSMHGLNEVGVKEDDPLWKKFLEQVCVSFAV